MCLPGKYLNAGVRLLSIAGPIEEGLIKPFAARISASLYINHNVEGRDEE